MLWEAASFPTVELHFSDRKKTVLQDTFLIGKGHILRRGPVHSGRSVVGHLLVEVDVEQGEDEAEHGRTEAVAKAADPRYHTLVVTV